MSDEKCARIPNFACDTERQRLGSAGLSTVFEIAALWGLTDDEALALLGLNNEWPIDQIKLKPPSEIFTEDRMMRISYLIGIYKGLHICHGDELADNWIKLRNTNPIFGGITPLEFMSCGG